MKPLRVLWMAGGIAFIAYVVVALAWKVEGRVIEEGSGKPIEGAFVVGTWSGHLIGIGHGSSGCYHVEFKRTDSNGRFTLSQLTSLNPLLWNRQRSIDVYAPGFDVRTASSEGEFVVARRSGNQAEQFDKVGPASTYDCVDPNDGRLLPMYKAVAQEALELASTSVQRKAALESIFNVERLELGEDEAQRRYGARLTKLYQEREKSK